MKWPEPLYRRYVGKLDLCCLFSRTPQPIASFSTRLFLTLQLSTHSSTNKPCSANSYHRPYTCNTILHPILSTVQPHFHILSISFSPLSMGDIPFLTAHLTSISLKVHSSNCFSRFHVLFHTCLWRLRQFQIAKFSVRDLCSETCLSPPPRLPPTTHQLMFEPIFFHNFYEIFSFLLYLKHHKTLITFVFHNL